MTAFRSTSKISGVISIEPPSRHSGKTLITKKQGSPLPGHSVGIPTKDEGFSSRRLPQAGVKQVKWLEETEASEVDIVLNEPVPQPAPVPVAQPENWNLAAAFGIPKEKLTHCESLSKFNDFKEQTRAWQQEKSKKFLTGSYVPKLIEYTDAEGNKKVDLGVKRVEPTHSAKLRDWQVEKGRDIQTGLKKVVGLLREKTGRPRRYGNTYLTDKGRDDPVGAGNQVPNDYLQAGASAARAAVAGKTAFGDPSGSAAASSAGLPTQAVDMMFATAAFVRLESEQEKAMDDLNFMDAGGRFVKEMADGTSADSRKWVKFMEAGDKVLRPTTEDKSTRDAAQTRVIRAVGSMSLNTAGAGVEIAKTVTSVEPISTVVLAVPKAALEIVEIKEGHDELMRRVDQKRAAESCIESMRKVLEETPENHADYAELEALVDCFSRRQVRKSGQATREKRLAEGRMVKGGAGFGATVGGVAAAATLVGLGAAPATFGLTAIVPAAVAMPWSIAVAARNHKRARAEHTAKWRQRMAQVVVLEMSPEQLKDALVNNTRIRFEQQEGDYVPAEDRFFGDRSTDFDARDNEYVGLRMLARKVQNLIKPGGGYDESSPSIRLVHAIGIDPLFLLAICKAAKPMETEAQLDYIQSRIALKLGMKFRVGATETQAPPHVSVFFRHFRTALSIVHDRYASGSDETDLYAELHDALEALYPDRRVGMLAFTQAIKTFLKKEEAAELPQTKFTMMLSGFTKYLDDLEKAPLEKALEKGKRLAAKQRAADARKEAASPVLESIAPKHKAAAINQLLEELERFAPMNQATRA